MSDFVYHFEPWVLPQQKPTYKCCGYSILSWEIDPDGARHPGHEVCQNPREHPGMSCRAHELMKLEQGWDILLQGWSSLSNFDENKTFLCLESGTLGLGKARP